VKKDIKVEKRIGRPRIEIDLALVKKCCNLLCTDEELADFIGVSVDTIKRRKVDEDDEFCTIYKKAKAESRLSLRRQQWLSAKGDPGELLKDDDGKPVLSGKGTVIMVGSRDPSVTAQIWLGKQILGQADKQEVTGKGGKDLIPSVHDLSDEELAVIAAEGLVKK
jgi:hypothetical protein|tara:strand:+ start:2072 stop:2566 length:495 start_codon:yes stop_codon:yes gene_type:complete